MKGEFKPVFRVDQELVFQRMRLKPTSPVFDKMVAVYQELLPKLEALVSFQGIYVVKPNKYDFQSSTLNACEKIVFCYATIGQSVCQEITDLLDQKELVKGYVLNEMANDVIMGLTNQMYLSIKKTLKKSGCHLTKRFSPGECTLDLSQQALIMDVLNQSFHVEGRLLKSYMIEPEKSSLFLYGADPSLPELDKDYDCSACSSSHNCPYKRD
jgi:RNA-binding protein YhbY